MYSSTIDLLVHANWMSCKIVGPSSVVVKISSVLCLEEDL